MATRSTISLIHEDGSVIGIYCHWDGYPEHNGEILNKSYTDNKSVLKLIGLGQLSILGNHIEPTGEDHSFENAEDDVCVAYHRDRGEDLNIYTSKSKKEFLENYAEEYNYFFENGIWTYKE